ncbi:MAG: hypothetical protein V1494_03380 [Candidatus Diapherotrites archaeon]
MALNEKMFLADLSDDDDSFELPQANEQMRLRLLKQELRLRKKQPTAWTKTKFRPYANFRTKKAEKAEAEMIAVEQAKTDAAKAVKKKATASKAKKVQKKKKKANKK